MRSIRRLMILITSITVSIIVFMGCNSSSQPDDLPKARSLLETSAATIQSATSFGLEITVSGYPITIELEEFGFSEDTPLFFKYARGVLQTPNRLSANIQFSLDDLSTTAQLIAIDRDHYFALDLLGNQWFQGELIPGFSPTSLIAQPGGLASALISMADLEMIGKKNLDGLDVFHLQGTLQAQDVYALTFGLFRTESGAITADVYVLTSNQQVTRITLDDPPPADAEDLQSTIWTINLLDYNQDVSILPPLMDQ